MLQIACPNTDDHLDMHDKIFLFLFSYSYQNCWMLQQRRENTPPPHTQDK